MAVTINADNGVSSGSAGLKQTADSTGVLALQTNGTTAVSISTGQVVTLTNALPVASGGTGATTNAGAAFALKGANSDITSLSGLTTALSVAQGGTGATSASAARTSLGLVIGTDVLAPNGSAASLTSFPTLNQNTTGSAATVTGNATGSTFGFNSGYGSVATAYGCRAWVNFNGTGTIAIRASGNVSSITDGGVGIYRVNFTSSMPDANFTTVASSAGAGTVNGSTTAMLVNATSSTAQTANVAYVDVWCYHPGNQVAQDDAYINVSVFR